MQFRKRTLFFCLFYILLTTLSSADHFSPTWDDVWTFESGAIQINYPRLRTFNQDNILITSDSDILKVCRALTGQKFNHYTSVHRLSPGYHTMVTIDKKGKKSEIQTIEGKEHITAIICVNTKAPLKKIVPKKIVPLGDGSHTLHSLMLRVTSLKGLLNAHRIASTSDPDGVCKMYGYKAFSKATNGLVTKTYRSLWEKSPRMMVEISRDGHPKRYVKTSERIFSINCTNFDSLSKPIFFPGPLENVLEQTFEEDLTDSDLELL